MTRRSSQPSHTRRLALAGVCPAALLSAALLSAGALQSSSQPGTAAKPASSAPAAREEAYRANNLGVAYLEQYNHEQGAASFRRALELDGDLTLARINLAIALLYLPDHAGAEREARAALQKQPDSPQAHYVIGLVARSENRADEGIAAFKRVLAVDPRDVGALVNLGQLLMQRREYAEAATLFRTAVEAEPYHVTATYNLAVALTRSGKTEDGQQMTAQFQKLRESGYGTTFSNNYLEQGRYAEALVSTGAEPELVSEGTPDVRFVETKTIAQPARPTTTPDQAARPQDPRAAATATRRTSTSGAVTLADIDRDDDLDVIDVSTGTLRLFLNDGSQLTDATARLGLGASSAALAAIAGDYDNDERVDLFVLGSSAHALFHQGEDGRFENRTAAAKVPAADVTRRAAAFVDVDHDGDLDLFLTGTTPSSSDTTGQAKPVPSAAAAVSASASASAANQLLRNNGDGTFSDVTADAKLAGPAMQGVGIAPTDYDNRRDLDLLVVGPGHAPVLFRNMRDGTFQDVAKDVGLPSETQVGAVALGDVNKDGLTDLFFGRSGGVGSLWLNDRGTRFQTGAQGPSPADALAAQFLDYDNDGLLDLVTVSAQRVSVWRNKGRAWAEVTDAALKEVNAAAAAATSAGPRAWSGFAAGDLDRDGDTDLVLKSRTGELVVLDNQGGSRNASVRVALTGRVSNRSAIGSKVEMRAGSLWQRLELSSTTPAAAPADLLFGLGTRERPDVVRVLWPAGIVQAEPLLAAPTTAAPSGSAVVASKGRAQVVTLTELDRKPSSCPFLYTWNGERFEFVTDFMGGGEMGYWHGPGVRNVPDPVEYVRIRGDQLRARNGRFELRVTNELEETLFVDRLRLLAIAHPVDVEVHPREGLFAPPFPPFELYAASDVRAPRRVLDHEGRDVTDRARAGDRRFIDRLPLERIRGYAREHTLTIDMSRIDSDKTRARTSGGVDDLLLLTGWTDYAFSSDNVAASQAGLRLEPPSLAVQDENGQWQTVIKEVGIPVGRPQTVVVNLAGKWRSASRLVQIRTSMRIYWDQIQVASRGTTTKSSEPVALDPLVADLRWRGFSAEATAEEPFTYDYDRVSSTSPWKLLPGRYTREGDVRELLRTTDDMFVVSRPGDEIALSFDATTLPALPTGWTRTFLLYSDGYSKEMDLHSASPDQAWPLPFHKMTAYPYTDPERYPLTDAHRAYIERYNTRIVGRQLPPLALEAAPTSREPRAAAR